VEVSVYAAKTNLSKLLARVEQGGDVVITRSGRPVARLVPIRPDAGARILGVDAGRLWIAPDFDAPLPDDVLGAFDRMIVAQALVEGVPVLTADAALADYDVEVIRA